ncbi:MAG: zinc ribbon domain-containing protein [Pirellulaceae bacterium]
MPTYDYVCSACGEEVEIFQKITDDPVKKCPACKKNKLERQFGTGAAIVFKGSGFYQTDYRSESYKKGAESDSKSKDSGAGGSEAKNKADSKSETKPSKKSDSKKPKSE